MMYKENITLKDMEIVADVIEELPTKDIMTNIELTPMRGQYIDCSVHFEGEGVTDLWGEKMFEQDWPEGPECVIFTQPHLDIHSDKENEGFVSMYIDPKVWGKKNE